MRKGIAIFFFVVASGLVMANISNQVQAVHNASGSAEPVFMTEIKGQKR
ncbi:hypothetical protein [Endozoicomonas ascidiicola]|nr:hypothetical protein [Endozoicomonas ascidiicola]